MNVGRRNGTEDGQLCRGLLRIERLPWKGFLSWEGVLEAKRRVFETLDHDWVMHLDADESAWQGDPARAPRIGVRIEYVPVPAAHSQQLHVSVRNAVPFPVGQIEPILRYSRCMAASR